MDVQGQLSHSSKTAASGTSTAVTVGNTSTTVLAASTTRKQAIIVNDSDEAVYIAYGATSALNAGIRINASGGSLVEDVYTGLITGICTSGSKVVTVTSI